MQKAAARPLSVSCHDPEKLSSSHGLIGTRASSPQADRMSALPVFIPGLAQKRIASIAIKLSITRVSTEIEMFN